MIDLTIGDNLEFLKNVKSNTVDLIYIDPPYNTGNKFKDYNDNWKTMEDYLEFMRPRLIECFRVLKDTGSLYLQCDDNSVHYLKVELDKVFGINYFRNEITWQRYTGHNDGKRFGRITDRILYYTKTNNFKFDDHFKPYSEEYIKKTYRHEDKKGKYALTPLTAGTLQGGGYEYEFHGHKTIWRCPESKMKKLEKDNMIHFPKKNKSFPYKKRYLIESKGIPLQDLWTDISPANSKERTNYSTQKPIKLLERIISASSNPGDLILDCFAGSCTSAIAAKRLNRKWIGCDKNPVADKILKERLK